MRTPTKDQLAAKLAKTIHEDLATRGCGAPRTVWTCSRGCASRRPSPSTPTTAPCRSASTPGRPPEDIDATLEELLACPARIAAERERRVALVLDEFQEVADIDPALIKLMRSVFQEQPEVAHIYLGSKRHMMQRIFNDENEPFWRSAKQMELGVIAPELFAPYALERFERPGRSSRRHLRAARSSSRAATPTRPRSSSTSSGRRRPRAGPPRLPHSIARSRRRCAPSTRTSA